MTMSPTYSIEEIAQRTRMSRDQVMARLRRKVNRWPHCRPNQRDASTWYFTEKDVEQIDALLRSTGPMTDSWGRVQRRSA